MERFSENGADNRGNSDQDSGPESRPEYSRENRQGDQDGKPPLEPWQRLPDPKHARDLDFQEIAALNKLEEEEEPRPASFWPLIVIAILLLLFFQTFIFHDALENFVYAQKIRQIDVPAAYSQNQMMVSSRAAVVLIRGDNVRGSGFNIDPAGLVITNRHVVKNESAVKVYFPDGSSYLSTKWQALPDIDLAVLAIDGQDLPFFNLAEKKFSEGQTVYFIGSPENSWWMMTEGIVGEYYDSKDGSILKIRLEQGIGPGASGSPVLDAEGKVGAVIFAVSTDDSKESFAIPISILQRYLSSSADD